MFQTTIQREVSTEGVGLHTGVFGHLRLLPAPADTGIVFRRTDLDDFRIEASGRNVARVSYATSLMKQGVLLSTTEHLLAAIYSYGLDNVFIVIEADRRIGIYPADEFHVECYVDFPHPLVGAQQIQMTVRPDSFRTVLAQARTFCFERDIEPLRSMGLIRGGSLDNAIVLTDDGVLNGPLRYPDEFGRHKALDLIGDLALVGLPLLGRVRAHKAGHALHTQLVSKVLADASSSIITTEDDGTPLAAVLAVAEAPAAAD